VLDVTGTAGVIENAFQLHLFHYRDTAGRIFHAPDTDPTIPATLAGRLSGVVGLNDAPFLHPHIKLSPTSILPELLPLSSFVSPGFPQGLSPSGIKTAYDLTSNRIPANLNGQGQILGLFELDGYVPDDIANYEKKFFPGLPPVQIYNIYEDTDVFSGQPETSNSNDPNWSQNNFEVALDIELQIALAPAASEIVVYEGPNTEKGVVDTYNRMTQDNFAKSISSSWGRSESNAGGINGSENSDFKQMAAQGQSMYVASGDNNNGEDYVTDPADQPYVTGVGGTSLNTDNMNGRISETVWNNGTGRSGGGVSRTYVMPSYQQGVSGMNTMAAVFGAPGRNIPDVALGADLNASPYAIYCTDAPGYGYGWLIGGGTSAAAPLWAAFNALVNQQRAINGSSTLGFPNPSIYSLAQGSHYQYDFHDITVGGNGNTSAQTGYDQCTGWGSFDGFYLLQDLAPFAPSVLNWGPSSAVNGNGLTNSKPVAVTYRNTLYLFIRGTDGHIYFNINNGSSWQNGYSGVPNNGSSPSGPAAAVYNGLLYLFIRGNDNNIYYTTFNGSSWSSYIKAPAGSTPGEPNPIVYNGFLYLFSEGFDNHIYYAIFNGFTWGAYTQTPAGSTPSAPAPAILSLSGNTVLDVFSRGFDNNVYDNTFSGSAWGTYKQSLMQSFTTTSSPAPLNYIGNYSNIPFVFYNGGDSSLYLHYYQPNIGWSTHYRVPPGPGGVTVQASDAPAAVQYNGYLYLFWIGTDNHVYQLQASLPNV
ncbi:MAG: S53 family peptidase, partial [Armatimonadota bacterium]|nr:S53 family peptidase [Armatimonadota bacterium]